MQERTSAAAKAKGSAHVLLLDRPQAGVAV